MLKPVRSLLGAAVIVIGSACSQADSQSGGPITGPVVHENLAVYFVKGDNPSQGVAFLTLSEAMDQGLITVHETGDVGNLTIDNVSDYPVFIQAGDIVKGGRQDRALAMDLIVPPASSGVEIASFCVERGRWTPRYGENPAAFEVSSKVLASKELKMAAMYRRSQADVWENVDSVKDKLSKVVGYSVADPRSATSLQLALENDKMEERIQAYVEAINAQLQQHTDIVGIAFAINGKINAADIYQSPELFGKCWPKLIEAAATEALANATDTVVDPPSAAEVSRWLEQSTIQDVSDEHHNGGTIVRTRDGKLSVVNELLGTDESKSPIHRVVLKK